MASSNEQLVVGVDAREGKGKNACRRMRATGKVPGNVYGMKLDSFAVSVEARRIEEILRLGSGRNTIFTLSLGDGQQSRAVMLRELQRDPVSERLVHVDFLRVDPTKKVHVQVPVRLLGTPEGVKNEGGVIDFVHREVEVSCLPSAIPEHLDVDVSHLHINQNVAVKELTATEGVEILDDLETILAVVASPRVEVEEAPEAEEVEAEAAAEGAAEDEAKTEESKEEGGEK
jgi:large subunit ribosomal protein L25